MNSSDKKDLNRPSEKDSQLIQESIATFQKTIDLAGAILQAFYDQELKNYDKDNKWKKIEELYKRYFTELNSMRYVHFKGEKPNFALDQQLIPRLLEKHAERKYTDKYEYLGEHKIPKNRKEHREFILFQLERIIQDTQKLTQQYQERLSKILLAEKKQEIAECKASILRACQVADEKYHPAKVFYKERTKKRKEFIGELLQAAQQFNEGKLDINAFEKNIREKKAAYIAAHKGVFAYTESDFKKSAADPSKKYVHLLGILLEKINLYKNLENDIRHLEAESRTQVVNLSIPPPGEVKTQKNSVIPHSITQQFSDTKSDPDPNIPGQVQTKRKSR